MGYDRIYCEDFGANWLCYNDTALYTMIEASVSGLVTSHYHDPDEYMHYNMAVEILLYTPIYLNSTNVIANKICSLNDSDSYAVMACVKICFWSGSL